VNVTVYVIMPMIVLIVVEWKMHKFSNEIMHYIFENIECYLFDAIQEMIVHKS
jgi:hypothetical protein